MDTNQNIEVIYPITVQELQEEAHSRIGRQLNDDELYVAKKCVEWGLSSIIDVTLKAAIEEAVEKNQP